VSAVWVRGIVAGLAAALLVAWLFRPLTLWLALRVLADAPAAERLPWVVLVTGELLLVIVLSTRAGGWARRRAEGR
jgi:hypothetical protein